MSHMATGREPTHEISCNNRPSLRFGENFVHVTADVARHYDTDMRDRRPCSEKNSIRDLSLREP